MKKLALAVSLAALAGLPACTTFNPKRRTMTNWNLSMLREPPDPCGTMSPETEMYTTKDCRSSADRAGRGIVDAVFVKPIAFLMMPISWVTDTLVLNPIDGYKKAELDSHERRFCHTGAEEGWSNAHAAHHAYGVVPVATPWVVSDALAAPEFVARWFWNSVTPTDPVDKAAYEEYWRQHNEHTGE
jgi:hypothetical protein